MRTHRTRRFLSPLGFAALAALMIAVGAGPAGAAGTFRIAVGVDLDTVDPAQTTTTTVANMVDYVAETLTSLGADGKVSPWLAESWTVSPDGLTQVELRPAEGHAGPRPDPGAVPAQGNRGRGRLHGEGDADEALGAVHRGAVVDHLGPHL